MIIQKQAYVTNPLYVMRVTFLTWLVAAAYIVFSSMVAAATSDGVDKSRWQYVSGKYTINVCFSGSGTTDVRKRAETALTNTWEAFSGIDFVFNGDCKDHLSASTGNVEASWIPIELNYDSANAAQGGGECQIGMGARLKPNVQCRIDYGSEMRNFETLVVHEVGHGLTLMHEHGRIDWPGRAEGIWTNPAGVCRDNLNTPAANTYRDAWKCDRHNTNTTIFNDPDGLRYCCKDGVSESCDTAPEYHVYHTQWAGGVLTLPVDPASIMSPWKCDTNRRALSPATDSNHPNFWYLSYYDALGIEIIYPYSFIRSARGRHGFITSSGIVVRSGDTLETDWTYRGALSTVYTKTPEWSFKSPTITALSPLVGTNKKVSTLALSVLSVCKPIKNNPQECESGTYTVSVNLQDSFRRPHTGTTSVVVDRTTHAALVMATLAP